MNTLDLIAKHEIEALVRRLPTSRKRINARKRIKEETNKIINLEIQKKKELLRSLRSESESAKRGVYADITKLELMLIG